MFQVLELVFLGDHQEFKQRELLWVSKNGCDTNSGLLEGDAKYTIAAAAAIAQEGDTIKVRSGIYY